MSEQELNDVLRNFDLSDPNQVMPAIRKCVEAAEAKSAAYIKLLKEEVGFAERGYTKMGSQ